MASDGDDDEFTRGQSPSRMKISLADVDTEAVRVALKEFVSRLISTERDRVSTKQPTVTGSGAKRHKIISVKSGDSSHL